MKDHVKYAQARNQLYHLVVLWNKCLADTKVLHPTPQYRQAVEMATAVLENARDAFERGNVLEVLINEYVPTPLPGFEEYIARQREDTKYDRETKFDGELKKVAAWLDDLDGSTADDPFNGAADWDIQGSQPPDSEDGDEPPGYDPFDGAADLDV